MTSFCRRSELNLFEPQDSTLEISRQLDCSLLIASILEMRGLADTDNIGKARAWISPSLNSILPTLDLGSNAREVGRLWNSIEDFGNVVVYGDYDVDGVSATVLAMEICSRKGTRVRYYIPHRHDQGYGLHEDVLENLVRTGCDTLIIVDCGSKDRRILLKAREAGLNVFVFDHHLVEDGYCAPPFVVNPQIDGDQNSRKLCATSVLWTWAFLYSGLAEEWFVQRLDLVALATVADCMPLNELNRSMVSCGLDNMKRYTRPGLRELLKKLDLSPSYLTEEHLAMKVIPCLNAAGRLELADTSVNLLAGVDSVSRYAEQLLKLNKKRQELSLAISKQVSSTMESESCHVMFGKTWPIGVLSGVASKLCNQKSQPVILAAPNRNSIRGTVRVPKGGDAIEVLDSVSDYLEEWGGHKFAAGFSVSPQNWNVIRDQLENRLCLFERPDISVTAVKYDPGQINSKVFQELTPLGPFGQGNPVPSFFHPRQGVEKFIPLGKTGEHFKISFGASEILAFNIGDSMELLKGSSPLGWLYHPRLDVWRGRPRLQFILDAVVIPD